MIRPAQPQPPAVLPEEMRVALRRCRGALLGACLFSAVVNVLAPTGTLYMLQLYDRVLPSHSVQTLVGLTVLMLLHYAGFGQDRAVAARAGVRRDYPARRPRRSGKSKIVSDRSASLRSRNVNLALKSMS